ncbi:MAG TPA: hypothetical protein DEG92_02945 [Rikenellaceae bacterium]|nr:hypothetical protein [Rikenellaceae bacterium]
MQLVKTDYYRYREKGHSLGDVIFSRGFQAVLSYRLRNWLHKNRIPFLNIIMEYITEVITGVEIPANVTIGKGLIIYHGGSVLINSGSQLGENVSIRPGVVIGGDYDGNGVPTLGNHIEIGVGAKILPWEHTAWR